MTNERTTQKWRVGKWSMVVALSNMVKSNVRNLVRNKWLRRGVFIHSSLRSNASTCAGCTLPANFHAFRLIPIMMLHRRRTVHSQFISGDSCSRATHTHTHTLLLDVPTHGVRPTCRLHVPLLVDSKNSDEIINGEAMRNFSMEHRRGERLPAGPVEINGNHRCTLDIRIDCGQRSSGAVDRQPTSTHFNNQVHKRQTRIQVVMRTNGMKKTNHEIRGLSIESRVHAGTSACRSA